MPVPPGLPLCVGPVLLPHQQFSALIVKAPPTLFTARLLMPVKSLLLTTGSLIRLATTPLVQFWISVLFTTGEALLQVTAVLAWRIMLRTMSQSVSTDAFSKVIPPQAPGAVLPSPLLSPP